MSSCKLCSCTGFQSNQFRKTLCQKCYHGYSSHATSQSGLWYIAKIEGPLTWEQLRHWYESGFLEDFDKLLVCSTNSPTEPPGSAAAPFKLMSEAFPDPSLAFIPKDVLEKKKDSAFATALAALSPHIKSSSGGVSTKVKATATSSSSVLNIVENTAPTPTPGSAAMDPDMLDPLELRSKSAAMRAYFQKGQKWFFVDSENKVQGPFPADSMCAWYDAGYFWSKKLLLAHEGWANFVALKSILDEVSSESASPSAQLEAKVEKKLATDSHVERKTEAPFTKVASMEPAQAAMEGAKSDRVDKVETRPRASAVAITEASKEIKFSKDAHVKAADKPVEVINAASKVSNLASADQWQYIDEGGHVQGPFPAATMAEWVSWGYFTDDVKIRNVAIMPEKAFLPLGVLFPDPGPDATEAQLAETAPFESDCWIDIWRRHSSTCGHA